jgi:hypothetical protein
MLDMRGLILRVRHARGLAAHTLVMTLVMVLVVALAVEPCAAQRTTPAGVGGATALSDTIADSLKRPPIAPRRAMVYSLLLPGFSQSRLNRPTSSIIFAVGDVLAIGMARNASLDLREARAARKDSIPTGFSVDTVTGVITATGYTQNRLVARIGARRTHYEDWLAAIIFNHLISGIDAYVAANLWDFKANVAVTPTNGGAAVGASLSFR